MPDSNPIPLARQQSVHDEIESNFRDLHTRIFAVCYRILGRLPDGFQAAEDLTNDTFLKALRSAEEFEGTCSLSSWMYRIATNLCLSHLRYKRRRPTSQMTDLTRVDENGQVMSYEPATDPLTHDRVESRQAVQIAIQGLPARDALILILAYANDHEQAEVAKRLGMTKRAVKSTQFRSRRRSRANLERVGIVETPARSA
jgi:RNA polymerase sigma-70 factor, ECF subfamily